VAVSGELCLRRRWVAGLRIVDVSDPAHPSEVGSYDTPGYASGVAVSGSYAYVADGMRAAHRGRLRPGAPHEVGFYDTPGYARGVAVSGSYAYVADGDSGLRIVDVSDPAHPREVGSYDTPGYASGVAVSGSYAYVADWWAGLRIVDVSDPAHPREVGSYDTPGCLWAWRFPGPTPTSPMGVAGLRIINVSDPAHPSEVGFLRHAGVCLGRGGLRVLRLRRRWGCGLRIVDVSDPAHPSEVGFYDTPGWAYGVAVSGAYAYVADGDAACASWTSPTRRTPSEVGFYDTPGYAYGVAVSGSYAYVADGDSGPAHRGRLRPGAPHRGRLLRHAGVCLWRGGFRGLRLRRRWGCGLRIVDVSDPAHPGRSASTTRRGMPRVWRFPGPTPTSPMGMRACASWTSPTRRTPARSASTTRRGMPRAWRSPGSYAYVADGDSGLRIINVSDPAHPGEVGFYDTPGYAYGVAVSGSYAYVADGDSGLRIINVADPAHPSEVGFYDTPGYAYGVAVSGSYAYVADGNSGLVILRLLRDKVMGSIPPTGGTLSSTSGDTRFLFPVDAVTQTITMVYRHLWTDQDTGPLTGIGHTFEVTAVYSDTGQPAQIAPGQNYTLTVHYTEAEKGPAIESTLALYYWDGNQWVQEPSSVLDTAANTVTAYPNHFSLWAVLGETKRVYLPLVLRNYR
jgi:hypothetical protein